MFRDNGFKPSWKKFQWEQKMYRSRLITGNRIAIQIWKEDKPGTGYWEDVSKKDPSYFDLVRVSL